MRRLEACGRWLERQSWWLSLSESIDRRVLTPPWERRDRPIDALRAARARIAADQRADDLPLLRELEWCVWVMGGEPAPDVAASEADAAARDGLAGQPGPDRQGPAVRL